MDAERTTALGSPWRAMLLVTTGLIVLSACGASASSEASASPASAASASVEPSEQPSAAPVIGDGEEWVVFQGVSTGLSMKRPDATGIHAILEHLPGEQVHADWSPDGSQLAFVQATDDETREIWISDPNGTSPEPLLQEYPVAIDGLLWDNPAWSRDGSRIVAVGYDGNPDVELPARSVLAIVELASGEVSVVSEFMQADGFLHSFPRWSPDGNAIVLNVDHFTGQDYLGSTLAVMQRDGTNWGEPGAITDIGQWSRPDWHWTDDLIVFCSFDIGGIQSTDEPSNLFTIRPDGTELTQITDFGPGAQRASQPTWTSDGRIIFTYITGPDDGIREVAIVSAEGSDLQVVVDADAVPPGHRPHARLRPVP